MCNPNWQPYGFIKLKSGKVLHFCLLSKKNQCGGARRQRVRRSDLTSTTRTAQRTASRASPELSTCADDLLQTQEAAALDSSSPLSRDAQKGQTAARRHRARARRSSSSALQPRTNTACRLSILDCRSPSTDDFDARFQPGRATGMRRPWDSCTKPSPPNSVDFINLPAPACGLRHAENRAPTDVYAAKNRPCFR
jgi:hypothetical protein